MKNICAMVLCWCDVSESNHWMLLQHNCRTMSGLRKRLQAGLTSGDWITWRLVTVIEEGKL